MLTVKSDELGFNATWSEQAAMSAFFRLNLFSFSVYSMVSVDKSNTLFMLANL